MLPFVALFSSVIGTPETPDYDSSITLPPAVSDSAAFIRDVLEEFAETDRPL